MFSNEMFFSFFLVKTCQDISLKIEDKPVSCEVRPANKDSLKEVGISGLM